MTTDKARKRAVRTRMTKTGERYTAARRNVVKPPATEPWATDDLGRTDEVIRTGSGKGWDEWIPILDAWGAKDRTHTEIARHVNGELGVPGWWAQTVTVGYERARGMRAVNQRPDGFSVSVSKTIPVDAATMSKAFTDARSRRRWLEPGVLNMRTSQPGRSARFEVGDGRVRAVMGLTAKGPAKTTVAIAFERLADKAEVEAFRTQWKERLAKLASVLGD
jgi:hypothetical protein